MTCVRPSTRKTLPSVQSGSGNKTVPRRHAAKSDQASPVHRSGSDSSRRCMQIRGARSVRERNAWRFRSYRKPESATFATPRGGAPRHPSGSPFSFQSSSVLSVKTRSPEKALIRPSCAACRHGSGRRGAFPRSGRTDARHAPRWSRGTRGAPGWPIGKWIPQDGPNKLNTLTMARTNAPLITLAERYPTEQYTTIGRSDESESSSG